MNANTIQAMIALNAAKISNLESDIGYYVKRAKLRKSEGETALSLAAYRKADNLRNSLRKAVSFQHTMKAEIQGIFRAARIASKVAYLKAVVGINFVCLPTLTSMEIENDLDDLIITFVPAKPDSRVAA